MENSKVSNRSAKALFAAVIALAMTFALAFSFQVAQPQPAFAADGLQVAGMGTSATTGTTTTTAAKGKLNKTSITLSFFKTYTLKLSGAKARSWKSSDKMIARVTSPGKVVPYHNGTTTITCTDTNGKTYKCKVTVTKPDINCKLTAFRVMQASNGAKKIGHVFQFRNRTGQSLIVNGSYIYYTATSSSSQLKMPLYNYKAQGALKLSSANPAYVRHKVTSKFIGSYDSVVSRGNASRILIDFRWANDYKQGKATYYRASFNAVNGKLIAWQRF